MSDQARSTQLNVNPLWDHLVDGKWTLGILYSQDLEQWSNIECVESTIGCERSQVVTNLIDGHNWKCSVDHSKRGTYIQRVIE